ncbi:hypothetical protein NHX12_016970 [Muraenolepis orangiensis]|uniref:Uncharacterized protein n=1 Tax=Muraenolepis orangiensis TaxID=630683 RepID=A0A9Q0D3K2_9TELE|nr:hypothetical protein NHX12_016970 [Muraenolepis orangiensis]
MQVRMMDRLAHAGDGLVSAVVTKCKRLLKCICSCVFLPFSIAVYWIPFPFQMDRLAHAGDGLVSAVVTKCKRQLKCNCSWLFSNVVDWILKRWPGCVPFPWICSKGDKPVILVVLHHTFDPEKNIIPQRMDSSHLFSLNKKLLLLNCLFYNHKLLTCDHNCKEIHKVIDHLSSFISKR